jgi:predicted nucleic acid-binding protein
MSFTDCAIITVAEIVNADSIVSFDAHIRRRSKVVPVFNGTE